MSPPPSSKPDTGAPDLSQPVPDTAPEVTPDTRPDAGGDTRPDAMDALPAAIDQMVSSEGALLMNAGGLTLDIPAGALATPTKITVAPSTQAPAEAVGPAFLFGPEGQTFAMPVAITLPFDPKLVPAGEQITVYTAAMGSTVFTEIEGVMADATHVQVQTTHFSVYVVGKKKPKLVSVEVTPTNPTIAKDNLQPFVATATFSNGSTADVSKLAVWASSNVGVATIDAMGVAFGAAAGTSTISAKLGGETGLTTLTVTPATLESIEVTPTNPTIARGTILQLAATGRYSDGSAQDLTASVTWSSATPSIASVSDAAGTRGQVTAVAVGTVAVTASFGGKSASTTLTVTGATVVALTVSPHNPAVSRGLTVAFTATATYTDASSQDVTAQAVFTSSNLEVVVISNDAASRGLATARQVGQATIGATYGGVSAVTTFTVTTAPIVAITVGPASPSLAKGTTKQLVATAVYGDNATQDVTAEVAWSSSSPSIATVSNASGSNGLVSGVAPGSTTITAALGSLTGTATLTVTSAVLSSITVTPTNPSLAKGTTENLTATGVYSDATTQDLTGQVTFTSSNPSVATVSNAVGSVGRVTAVKTGWAYVSATLEGKTGMTTVTVTTATLASIQVTPTNPTIANGTAFGLSATGVYTDGSTQDHTADATWASDDTPVATVSNAMGSKGTGTGVMPGDAVISASYGGKTGSTTLTVSAAVLVSIEITPGHPAVAKGTTQAFVATGLYTDASHGDLTDQVTWSSSNPSVAPISNVAGTRGLASGAGVGSVTITATLGGKSATTSLTVTAATLVSIAVTPANPSLANGTSTQLTATGSYSDGSTQNLTSLATWTSNTTMVAAVSNAAGSKGSVSGVGVGASSIGAAVGGISGSTTLTVTSATLVSIAVTPPNATAARGTSSNYTAMGLYSDGQMQDITDQVTWSSSDPARATASNASGSEGRVTAVAEGLVAVLATQAGVTGSTSLTVTAATLVSITVTPPNPTVMNGGNQQFVATGVYSDGSSQPLTDEVTWSSSATGVATISNAAGTRGQATTLSLGTTTITAALGGTSGGTLLTVN